MLAHRNGALVELLRCTLLCLVVQFLLTAVTNATMPMKYPRVAGTPPTYSASFMGERKMHYYLTSYTHATFHDDAKANKVLYNSSVSKHMFAPLWLYYIPDSTIRLDAVTAIDDDSIVVAGTSESVFNTRVQQRLFIATVVHDGRTQQLSVTANYTSSPASFVKVSRVIVIDRRIFVCGRRIPLKNSTDSKISKASGAFLYSFDSALQTMASVLPEEGNERDSCADIVQAEMRYIHIAQTRYTASSHYGVITAKSLNSFDAPVAHWETILDSTILRDRRSGYNNETDIAIIGFCQYKSSIFVVARLFNRFTRSGAHAAIFKLSARTGAILWVHQKLVTGGGRGTELVGSLGAVVASDHYLYSVLRFRNGTGVEWPPEKNADIESTYASFVTRISIWGTFDVVHDISVPLWVSSDVRGPAAGLVFSELQGLVMSLGGGGAPFKRGTPPGGGGPPRTPTNVTIKQTSVVLPLGPKTNDAKTGELPFGKLGSQFLRITFKLKAKGTDDKRILDVAADILAEMMRLLSTQVKRDGRSKFEDMTETLGEVKEVSQTYGLLVRDDELGPLQKKVFSLIELLAQKRDLHGWSLLEKRMNLNRAGLLQIDEIKVRSRGVTKAPDGDEKKRSAADVAQDLVKNTTITGVAIAGILVAVVAAVVGFAKLRRMWKDTPDSRASLVSEGSVIRVIHSVEDRPEGEMDIASEIRPVSFEPRDLMLV